MEQNITTTITNNTTAPNLEEPPPLTRKRRRRSTTHTSINYVNSTNTPSGINIVSSFDIKLN